MAAISTALRAGSVNSASETRTQSRTVAFTSPVLTASANSEVSPQPSQLVAASAVAPGSRFSKANAVGEALIVFAIVVMAVVFVRRRRSGARARRRARRPRAPIPAADRDNYYATTGSNTHGGLDPWTNDPSFSSGPAPRWTSDHPSFPGGPDPRWTSDQGLGMRAIGRSDLPGREPLAPVHHDPRWQAASPSARGPQSGHTAANWGPPAAPMADTFDRAPGWSPQPTGTVGPANQAHNKDIYGQLPVIVADAPLRRQAATDLQVRPEYLPPYAGADAAELAGPVRRQVEDLWSADSVRLANQILAEADDQAAATLATAEQEAANMRRQASDQAAATLATAEQEAAELRAAVMQMSAELGAVAAYVTENFAGSTIPAVLPRQYATKELLSPADPVTMPAAWPTTEPTAQPAAKPATKTAARPAAKTVTKTATPPATKPESRRPRR